MREVDYAREPENSWCLRMYTRDYSTLRRPAILSNPCGLAELLLPEGWRELLLKLRVPWEWEFPPPTHTHYHPFSCV